MKKLIAMAVVMLVAGAAMADKYVTMNYTPDTNGVVTVNVARGQSWQPVAVYQKMVAGTNVATSVVVTGGATYTMPSLASASSVVSTGQVLNATENMWAKPVALTDKDKWKITLGGATKPVYSNITYRIVFKTDSD